MEQNRQEKNWLKEIQFTNKKISICTKKNDWHYKVTVPNYYSENMYHRKKSATCLYWDKIICFIPSKCHLFYYITICSTLSFIMLHPLFIYNLRNFKLRWCGIPLLFESCFTFHLQAHWKRFLWVTTDKNYKKKKKEFMVHLTHPILKM